MMGERKSVGKLWSKRKEEEETRPMFRWEILGRDGFSVLSGK